MLNQPDLGIYLCSYLHSFFLVPNLIAFPDWYSVTHQVFQMLSQSFIVEIIGQLFYFLILKATGCSQIMAPLFLP